MQRQVVGKAPEDRLFPITNVEANKLAHELSAATGIAFVPKNLRAAFASIASNLMNLHTYKRVMNRGRKNDTDDINYIKKLESELRAAWQAVADFIEAAAGSVGPGYEA
ncbi:hypothetical protein D3C84_1005010 [compost metagenome]